VSGCRSENEGDAAFQNRDDAGEQLADLLAARDVEADVVLGIPRGTLPVARPVADRLDADLDVIVARKMGAPHNEELAIGVVASDGSVWRNDDLTGRFGVDEVYAVEEPAEFRAVGKYYRDFGQVSDTEARRYLDR